MKKWQLFSSLFQMVVGIAAIIAYVIIASGGEPMGRWNVTLLLAIAFLVIGIVNLIEAIRSGKKGQ